MTSKIKVQRICQHCGNEFTALTTTTQYCSSKCRSASNKDRIRNEKIEKSNAQTKKIISKPIEELKEKEFLSVRHVSILLGCSRQNVYKLINNGKLKATNILEKKTIIKRVDLDKLFDKQPNEVPQRAIQSIQSIHITDCYAIGEIQAKFGVSQTAVQFIIKRNNIPKFQKGKFLYVPKIIIDKILSSPKTLFD